jgi:hypothetical protein
MAEVCLIFFSLTVPSLRSVRMWWAVRLGSRSDFCARGFDWPTRCVCGLHEVVWLAYSRCMGLLFVFLSELTMATGGPFNDRRRPGTTMDPLTTPSVERSGFSGGGR